VQVETGKTPLERMTFFERNIIIDSGTRSLETRKKTKVREVGVRVRGKTWGRELSSIVLQYFKVHFSSPFWLM